MELGIDISSHRSKSLDEFVNEKFDFVITLCAMRRKAVRFFSADAGMHMGFPIPRLSRNGRGETFLLPEVRDQIRKESLNFYPRSNGKGHSRTGPLEFLRNRERADPGIWPPFRKEPSGPPESSGSPPKKKLFFRGYYNILLQVRIASAIHCQSNHFNRQIRSA